MSSHPTAVLATASLLVLLGLGARPLASQTCDSACNQFIAAASAAIEAVAVSSASHPLIYGGNIPYANGMVVDGAKQSTLIGYVDGLKAAGVQRVEFNPGVTSITDPIATALYDAMVTHIRQLGMELAINPEFTPGELGQNITFQTFETVAMQNYPALVARYQPDVFVIVHEPTTATGSMGVPINQDWHDFILTMIPVLRKASPRTKLSVGAFQNGAIPTLTQQEGAYMQDWITNISGCAGAADNSGCLDLIGMDVYNTDTFPTYIQWATEAHANNKGAYVEETYSPHYLPNPLPSNALSPQGYLTASLDDFSILGAANPAFALLDTNWLQGMSKFAAGNGMEALTVFTTETFFAYGTTGHDKIDDPVYNSAVINNFSAGQLTSTAQSYRADVSGQNPNAQAGIKMAVSISSASYATLPPNVFDPDCGTATNPCNANATVAPDALVSVFGTDLATSSAVTSSASFPTTLAGSTMTLVDSANLTYSVPMYSASPMQVNYYVPGNAAYGPASVTITSGDGTETTGIVLIEAVAPGLYTANQNGIGVAAAIAVCAGTCTGYPATGSSNGQFFEKVFACGSTIGSCLPQPISLGDATDSVVVELFGTGIRHVSSRSAISAQINGQSLMVQYAGAQGGYTGLDQVNVQIPHSLAGSGLVNLVISVQDSVNDINTTFNTVTLDIE